MNPGEEEAGAGESPVQAGRPVERGVNRVVCTRCGVTLVCPDNWSPSRRAGRSNSCKGCDKEYTARWRENNRPRLRVLNRKYKGAISYMYANLVRSSRAKGVGTDLTLAEYTLLRSKPCYYCRGPLPAGGIGLDQVLPGRGYYKGNVVPCCAECNRIKSDRYTKEQMRLLGSLVATFKKGR